jgi:hypothetical protein
MVDSSYSWPRYPTGSEEHLKALGVISLNFNLYEFSLVTFLEQHLDKDVANLLFDKLNSEARAGLIYCADYQCSHWIRVSADPWPDQTRLSDLEDKFTCTACGQHGAEVRPDFDWDKKPVP